MAQPSLICADAYADFQQCLKTSLGEAAGRGNLDAQRIQLMRPCIQHRIGPLADRGDPTDRTHGPRICQESSQDKPPQDIESEISTSSNLSDVDGGQAYAVEATIGLRKRMEDTTTVATLTLPGFRQFLHFYACYDGHGGHQASLHCSINLHLYLQEALNNNLISNAEPAQYVLNALTQAYHQTDEEFSKDPICETVGSTAVVVLVGDSMIWIANLGDSRAALCSAGQAIQLTQDQKPNREDEVLRIIHAGGQILHWNGPRVMGVLNMTRSIGDTSLRPYVIPVPEVTVRKRSLEDDFLILASDGFWDALTTQEACDLALQCFAASKDKPRDLAVTVAARVLVRSALSRGSSDNVSVIVVDLHKSGSPRTSPRK